MLIGSNRTTLIIGRESVQISEGKILCGSFTCDETFIDVCKFAEREYGHFAGSGDTWLQPDHLTIARWKVRSKIDRKGAMYIITSAAKSFRS